VTRRRTSLRIGRTVSSVILAAVGTLLTMVGIVYLWADDSVFNSNHFASIAISAARKPPVKTEISRVLVDQAVKAKPDLITIRPLLETVIETIISTPVFGRILVPAVGQLHHSVFSTDKRSLALDVSDGLSLALSGLRVVNPQIADQIPPDLKTGLIEIGRGGVAPGLTRTLNDLHTLMFALGIVGVFALAASVVIATSRRKTIIAIGISLTVTSLLLFLAIGVGHQILVRQFDVDSTASAAGSVYDTFLNRLSTWLWIVDIGGILVAAAATATFRTTGARGQFEGL